MIKANTDREWLPLYEALASEVRLQVLEMLAEGPMNVKDIAQKLSLSPAILTMHTRKLERGGLISTEMVRKQGGTHKMCSLKETKLEIELPSPGWAERSYREQAIPVGHYTSFDVHPTCGLATKEKLIGQFDDPRYFLEPERVNAAILWLGHGYIEYKMPNFLLPSQEAEELEIAMEISSEAPGTNESWPSDIRFYLNEALLGEWTSPGDFGGDKRGRYTPDWWHNGLNQYGLWKVLRVNGEGTYIDGNRLSDTKIGDLRLGGLFWTLRFAVEENSTHVGGLTLFGSGFGNYSQDIKFRVYYRNKKGTQET